MVTATTASTTGACDQPAIVEETYHNAVEGPTRVRLCETHRTPYAHETRVIAKEST